MTYSVHTAQSRGVAEHGWLHSRLSFSFAEWYDPERMGFGALRVINDDVIDPESGFDMHHHENMEIITLVMKGVVTHEDSMGNAYQIPAGDVQVMSAGSGIQHSEWNRSGNAMLQLFQVWIVPKEKNRTPSYDQGAFLEKPGADEMRLVVSPDGREGSLTIHQDAFVYRGALKAGHSRAYFLKGTHTGIYLFIVSGCLLIEGELLKDRDAIGISDAIKVHFQSQTDAVFLLFEVPML